MKPYINIPHSERLHFRLMDEKDADLLFELDQDPEVMRYLNDGKPTPREDIDNYFIPRMMDFTDAEAGCGLWSMEDRENAECLGWILVRPYGFSTDYCEMDNLELGWRTRRSHWNKGLTTEGATAIINVLKELRPEINKFSAIVDADNIASVAVAKKLGMTFKKNTQHVTPKATFDVEYYDMPAR